MNYWVIPTAQLPLELPAPHIPTMKKVAKWGKENLFKNEKVKEQNMSIQTVTKKEVSNLFNQDSQIKYKIPKYQREYSWGVKEWDDIFVDITENKKGYFLGSILCVGVSTINEEVEIIDGQQRLITLSLFLAALYDTLQKKKEFLNEDQNSDVIQLRKKLLLKNQDITRVIPQEQGNNREDFEYLFYKIGIISQKKQPKNLGNRRIKKAFNHFKNRITVEINRTIDEKDKNNSEIDKNKIAIDAMFDILDKINSAILVVIEVSTHSDAYILFESLNNTGKPLTSVDLIKNVILAKLDNGNKEDLDKHYSHWKDILNNLGDEYHIQERFFRQNYNAFRKTLNAPFVNDSTKSPYPIATIATRSDVLEIYEKIITQNPEKALNELHKNSEIYSQIILKNEPDISKEEKEVYQKLQRIEGTPSYVLLMYLIKNKEELNIDKTHIIKICKLLVKFFVRRNLTNEPPTNKLQRSFMSFIEKIENEKYQGEDIYKNLFDSLKSFSADDETFKNKLRGSIYDDNTSVTRFILCSIEENKQNKENKIDLWEQEKTGKEKNRYIFSIEHIFPQGENIPQAWVDMIADGDIEKAKEAQSQYVHTLGNLTITAYNSNLGNKSFEEKKVRQDKDSKYIGYKNGFYLNQNVCNKDKWTIENIKKRTDDMVKEIMELFAL